MIKLDENALICDLAETYQIYSYRKLPPLQVAIFAAGLRNDSRIKMRLANAKVEPNTLLLVGILDRLSLLLWSKTDNARKGIGKPESLMAQIYGEKKENEISAFVSGKEFEEERKRIIEGR